MLKTTININNVELNIALEDDVYEVNTKQEGNYKIEAPQEGLDLLEMLITITNKVKKIDYILKSYENSPSFVMSIINDKTNGEDFSDLSVADTLTAIDVDILDEIYSQIIQLKKIQYPLKIDVNKDNEIIITKQDGSIKTFHVSGVAYIDLIEAGYNDDEVAQAWNFVVKKLSELNNN